MTKVLEFSKFQKSEAVSPKPILLEYLVEDGIDPAIAESALNDFEGPLSLTSDLPGFSLKVYDPYGFLDIPEDQLNLFNKELKRCLAESVDKFHQQVYHRVGLIFLQCLLIYARELANKK